MYLKTLTLAAGANRVVPKDPVIDHPAPYQSVTFQNNNATNAVYLGDSAVSSSNGYKLASGTSITFTTPVGDTEDLKAWYAAPTAGSDKLTVLVIE